MYTKKELIKNTLIYFDNDELATNAWINKYALKDDNNNYIELTPDDMHHRMTKEFYRIEEKYANGLTYDQIYNQLKNFNKIIPQGSIMYGLGNPRPVSLSNCTVVKSPEDNMSSIINTGRDIANLSKRRAGIGGDLSHLRPTGAKVNNSAGTTSGAYSFADLYSYLLNTVGQNGRRGAGMISLHIKHPDAELFATMKQDLTKVTGANVSLRITDEFMIAVRDDLDFVQQWPIDSQNPKIIQTIKARKLWDIIVNCATKTGEPGIMLWDNITKNLASEQYPGHEAETSNPCGEQVLPAYDSCRLIAINLLAFVVDPFTKNAYFDYFSFKESCRIMMRLGDDLVDLEIEKLNQIIEAVDTIDEKELWKNFLRMAQEGRRTGLGTTALADTFAALNIKYDSDAALYLADNIYRTLKETTYTESINLAKERGPFPIFNWYLDRHCKFNQRMPTALLNDMYAYGRRNIVILTNAPTGTVSILTRTSSGIEPVFRLEYTRRKKINHDDTTSQVDFIDQNGVRWQEFKVYHHNFAKWFNLNRNIDHATDGSSPWVTSDQIDWEYRIKLQSVIQNHIDNSISSTINLPKGTSVEIVKNLYMKAWELGLKGVTVYVDESRTGVLVTTPTQAVESYKRDEQVPVIVRRSRVRGQDWIFLIGMRNDKPYEIFGGRAENLSLDENIVNGFIVKYPRKKRNSRYDFKYVVENKNYICKDLIKLINSNEYNTLTRFVSLALRHEIPIQFIIDQLNKNEQDTLLDFAPVLSRTLKEFIPDGTSSNKDCPSCGANALLYQEGCLTCTSCGYSKCGG